MSHVTVDGRTLTDAERIKFAAELETEPAPLDKYGRIIELGLLLKSMRKERNQLEARIGNLQAEFDALTAEVAS